ncbi:MFS transporter [Nocardioides sp.]|uniref:MFS transporter n=1 Tax=Nocardioides sp. TaxID=35761 RepID=UPI003D0A760F
MSLVAGTYGLIRLAYGLYLSDIQASLHLSSSAVGYISSGASVAYSVGALVGLLVERQPRVLVLAALLTGSVGSAGMALASSAAAFVPAAIVASAGAGLASPGMVGIVDRNVRAHRQGHAQAVVNSGTGPGLVAAGALALVLLPQWRAGFVIGAVFTALAGVAVLILDRSRSAPSAQQSEGSSGEAGWRFVLELRTPATGALLLGVASAAVWTYGRTQLVEQEFGGTWSTIGWIAVGLGGTATVLTARRLHAWRPEASWFYTCVSVAISIATLALDTGLLAVALVACFVFGWAFVAATTALIAWVSSLVPERATAGTSVLFIILTLGQAMGSALAGNLADRGGLSLAFLVAAAIAALGAACGSSRA